MTNKNITVIAAAAAIPAISFRFFTIAVVVFCNELTRFHIVSLPAFTIRG